MYKCSNTKPLALGQRHAVPPLLIILKSVIYTYNTSKMKLAFPSHLVQKMIDGLFPGEGEDFLALHVKQSMKEGKYHSIRHMFFLYVLTSKNGMNLSVS